MLRILLALVVITVLFYMNPLTKMDANKLDEKKRSAVERQVNDVQQKVDEAKKIVQNELEEVTE